MKKMFFVLAAMMVSLTACGADDAAKSVSQTVATTATETAANAVTAAKSASTTVISPAATEALKMMSPENGDDNFDAAAVLAKFEGKFEAGVDYKVISPAQPTSSAADVVEVTEVFMYSCPHCYSFEPFIKEWLKRKPTGVNFQRIPAQFNRPAQLHAAAYYAAEALGVGEQVHLPMFTAIHVKRNPLSSKAAIREIFTANNVDGADFDGAFDSFEVDTKTRTAADLSRRYRIESVPTLVINGKYQATGSMAKSTARLNDIVDYLVAKELAER